jgi:hypothetical protein
VPDEPDLSAVAGAVARLFPDELLVGFVIVAEWAGGEDGRALSMFTYPEDTPSWHRQGWLAEAQVWEEAEA